MCNRTESQIADLDPAVDLRLVNYAALSREERLRQLDAMHRASSSERAKAFLEGRMLEVTIGLETHPYWFKHGCLCDDCQGVGA